MNPTEMLLLSQPIPSTEEAEADKAAPAFQFSDDDLALLLAQFPEAGRGREADHLAWWRVLPQLLAEGEQGRVALIHEGQLVSVWDTYADAVQAGYDKFGIDARFFTAKITQRELDNLKKFLT